MHDQFLQGSPNRAQGQVAGHHVVPGHLQQGLGDAFEVSGQGSVENLLAGQAGFFDEVRWPLAVPAPEFGEGAAPAGSCWSSETWFMNS
nr:hypothetical protein GCM10020185_73980 [Pseudomonas brassicacearum subsp. brassicacearum]